MYNIRAIRRILANLLRIVHITLWMTIPATLLLLFSLYEPWTRACAPDCGRYQGNILVLSENTHIWIAVSLWFLGFFVWVFWVNGYCFEIVRYVVRGNSKLPPIQRGLIRDGLGLVWFSFRYWLPVIGPVFFALWILSTYPARVADQLLGPLMPVAAPIALVIYWGQLVGIMRFAASGQKDLIFRRRENIRIALTNLKLSLVYSGLVVAVIGLGYTAWTRLLHLGEFLLEFDMVLQSALGAFVFFFVLLTGSFACSWLIGIYGLKLGVRGEFIGATES